MKLFGYDLLVEILLQKAEWNLQHQIQTFNKIKHILGSGFFLSWHVATWQLRKKGCDSHKGFFGGKKWPKVTIFQGHIYFEIIKFRC